MVLSRLRLFPRTRRSVPAARDFAVGTMSLWGIDDRLDDLRLGVSELAANAVLHGAPPGRHFCVRMSREGALIRVGVRDSGDGTPLAARPDGDACSGRGLWLASAVADDCGVVAHRVGKTVWLAFEVGNAEGAPVALPRPSVARADGGERPLGSAGPGRFEP
ncbi:ATP-binding protein [Streptomyces fuscigenes]|uniref:ATP-binding protein n=1 Tax=Streptomyces fuscigenes TaxID=1528880 RepID=UPI0027E071E8|nr:ATP-binding protein [Streptomyces fuscigenes]